MKKFDSLINLIFALTIVIALQLIFRWDMTYLIVIFLIIYPWRYKGNVYSLFGGMNTSGSVYSLFGIFQIASQDAKCFLACLLYQDAKRDSEVYFGFSVYQHAKNDSICWFGVSLVQIAEANVFLLVGVNLIQISRKEDITNLAVISLYQEANGHLMQVTGVSVCQKADYLDDWTGIYLFQRAVDSIFSWFCVSIYQLAKHGGVKCLISISLIQRAEDKIATLIYLSIFQWTDGVIYVGLGLSLKKAKKIENDSQLAVQNIRI